MIMVIFGAGASYDSVPARPPKIYQRRNLPNRPPLAAELFLDAVADAVNALESYPRCKPIIPYLQSIPPGETLEHVLETLQSEGDTDPERKRQMVAIRFYLQMLIAQCADDWDTNVARGVTNYATLLDQLRRCRRQDQPVLLVTFNYDRMIERAILLSLRISIPDLPHYIQDDAFKLFKLHGSVHWGREVENFDSEATGSQLAQEMIEGAPELRITGRYRLVENWFQPRSTLPRSDDAILFPAIAIPVEKKLDFECPSEHLECLRKHLGEVTKVLTVGWAAQEQHFLKLLKKHLTKRIHVTAVAGTEAEGAEVLDRIKGAGIGVATAVPVVGFTEYANSRDAERFLASEQKG